MYHVVLKSFPEALILFRMACRGSSSPEGKFQVAHV